MDTGVSNKVIVVTGAGRGIGQALARGLVQQGARVAVIDLDGQQLEQAAKEVATAAADPAQVLPIVADVTDEAQIASAASQVDRHWGQVDAVISNAGWMPPVTPILDLGLDVLHRTLDINLVGCFLVTKHFAPLMIRNGGGRLIYMSSIIGVQAPAGQAAYGASKAGVTLLANVAHRELASLGIRTVALAPGLTDTPGMRASVDDAYVARVAAAYPGGRLGQPDDVLAFAVFLCSDAANHLSGTLLPIRPVTG